MLGNWKAEHNALCLCCFKINKKFLHKIKVLSFFDGPYIIPCIYYLFYFYTWAHVVLLWGSQVHRQTGQVEIKLYFWRKIRRQRKRIQEQPVNISNSPACWMSCLHEEKYIEFRTRSFREKRFFLSIIIKNLCKNLLKIQNPVLGLTIDKCFFLQQRTKHEYRHRTWLC